MRLKRLLVILILLMGIPSFGPANDSPGAPFHYQILLDRLTKDGFDKEFLLPLFLDPRAEPIPKRMTISLLTGERPEIYKKFLTLESILVAKNFLRQNLRILKEMENRFDVEKEVPVAILMVESRFGENIGKHRVIPTLGSIALMDTPENLQKNYQILRELDPALSYAWMEGLAKKRANWAYQELRCFLGIISHERIDPLDVMGSHAGALGMAQFIPSSYLAYAQSKKGLEGWLLDREEAIFSIGNYLKSHGWKKDLPVEKQGRILWYYNRSKPYVETILQIADKIKK
ncbi:MAG: hypothetical protein A2169_08155 [Deltaproteobacteria bacterium RBG_13_47_9]|nr:MAG: hypothetical protein A2169_08155 [Deltaproteobacteria bacterium RBG_13_47_9]